MFEKKIMATALDKIRHILLEAYLVKATAFGRLQNRMRYGTCTCTCVCADVVKVAYVFAVFSGCG